MAHQDRCSYCGTISHGTLRPEDLIPAFAEALAARLDELEEEQRGRGRSPTGELRRALEDLEQVELRVGTRDYYDTDDANEDLEWLQELLEYYAPPGHYFGAHPGDGSDFGFWPLDLLDRGEEESTEETVEGRPAAGGGNRSARPSARLASARGAATDQALPEYRDTHVETWFERDRAHVALYDSRTHAVVAEWWDEDVGQAVEDGFLDPKDYHRSAYDYARHLAGEDAR